ncbi:hypothetical protein ACLGGT_14680 [Roseovarius sp. MS2]|uniref:hypothetical protein n=1 Tax=Roseovarius sp. MS2 TaxID=3390728 RepID=UPI003EDBD560
MPELFDTIAPAALADHEIRLFYKIAPVDPVKGPDLCIGDIAKPSDETHSRADRIFPTDQLEALRGRESDTTIWAENGTPEAWKSSWTVSSDLHPSIQDLLNGQRPLLARFWELTVKGKGILTDASVYEKSVPPEARTQKKRLALSFSKAALGRIQRANITVAPLILTIETCSIAAFASGFSACCVSVRVERADKAALSAVELVEVIYALSRSNSLHWVDLKKPDTVLSDTTSLGQVVRLFCEGGADRKKKSNRVDTYVYAQLAEHHPIEAAETLAAFLCRRYTSDYRLDVKNAAIETLRDFSNLRHSIAIEGAASVLVKPKDETQPDYLTNWRTTTFSSSYAHLFLLALHEDIFLTKNRAHALEKHQDDDALERIDDLIEETLIFRMCFRYFSVSALSMHTFFSQALRKARFLDRKLDELEGDVRAMSERLIAERQQQAEVEERSRFITYSKYAIVGGAFLAGLTAFTLTEEILNILQVIAKQEIAATIPPESLDGLPVDNAPILTAAEPSTDHAEIDKTRALLPLGIGALVTVSAWFLGFRYRLPSPRSRRTGRLSIKAMTLRMLRGSLR